MTFVLNSQLIKKYIFFFTVENIITYSKINVPLTFLLPGSILRWEILHQEISNSLIGW